MADKNYEFFINNFDDLYKKYKDKYLAIKDGNILGVYDSFDIAFDTTIQSEEIGSFLIQWCSKNENAVDCFYSNNVVFA